MVQDLATITACADGVPLPIKNALPHVGGEMSAYFKARVTA